MSGLAAAIARNLLAAKRMNRYICPIWCRGANPVRCVPLWMLYPVSLLAFGPRKVQGRDRCREFGLLVGDPATSPLTVFRLGHLAERVPSR